MGRLSLFGLMWSKKELQEMATETTHGFSKYGLCYDTLLNNEGPPLHRLTFQFPAERPVSDRGVTDVLELKLVTAKFSFGFQGEFTSLDATNISLMQVFQLHVAFHPSCRYYCETPSLPLLLWCFERTRL
ncbi:hypothetical protein PoB_005432200 [Plakobranchus ocellatus]|uniref:Uncharacterized protein n=1 Tax=Plakobranchus ocellatus TaxID=259542 RepID=A0AAV4C8X3_9GAST|nr:hypothetical protein PoB_005432200 [Plakobranchus ocellatus]